jgi:L-asparaginase II
MTERDFGSSSTTAAVVTRGEGVDAVHAAVVAVVDGDGRLTHAFGDAEVWVFTRSAIKPFQTLALVRSGAMTELGLELSELAIASASHSGSDRHVEVVKRLLAKAGASVADLGCGTQLPIGLQLQQRYPQAGEDQDPLRHNCSGKHAGFLALARMLGQPFERYLEAGLPVESAVRNVVAEACEVPVASMAAGVDGCSATNYAMPLVALARGAKNLALSGARPAAIPGLARVGEAMSSEPLLVSGEGRFDAQLCAAFPGNVVAKGGAEGVQLIGFSDPPLGIAIKVLDGAQRAVAPIAVRVLESLGVLAADDERLVERAKPVVTNARGLVTGEIVPVLALRRVG